MNNERLGEIRNNKRGTPMKIIRYGSADDIDIEFLDEFHYVKKNNTYSNFKSGGVKNPYDRIVHGVGYIGIGNHPTKVDGKTSRIYNIWHEIIARCYGEKEKDKYPAYYGKVTVCDEWHCFHTFADWYEENFYKVDGRLHVDKDILNPKSMMYSPANCLLTPQRINMLFVNPINETGLPTGIKMTPTSRYCAEYCGKYLGVYDTLFEAYDKYAEEKEKAIKRIADEYKSIIPSRLYEALYNYKVDINNDRNYVAS